MHLCRNEGRFSSQPTIDIAFKTFQKKSNLRVVHALPGRMRAIVTLRKGLETGQKSAEMGPFRGLFDGIRAGFAGVGSRPSGPTGSGPLASTLRRRCWGMAGIRGGSECFVNLRLKGGGCPAPRLAGAWHGHPARDLPPRPHVRRPGPSVDLMAPTYHPSFREFVAIEWPGSPTQNAVS
jgi:hypothetical protein